MISKQKIGIVGESSHCTFALECDTSWQIMKQIDKAKSIAFQLTDKIINLSVKTIPDFREDYQ